MNYDWRVLSIRLSTFHTRRKALNGVDSVGHNNLMINLQAFGITDELSWEKYSNAHQIAHYYTVFAVPSIDLLFESDG